MAIVNKTQLADIVGRTPQTLTTWQKNGMPIHADGRNGQSNQYDTAEVIQWMIRQQIEKLTISGDGQVFDYEAERARLTHHQANKTALEERQLHGELIHAEKVQWVWGKLIAAFRAKCLSIPTKTAPRVQSTDDLATIEQELRISVNDALTELSEFRASDYGIRVVPEVDSEGGTASESDNQ